MAWHRPQGHTAAGDRLCGGSPHWTSVRWLGGLIYDRTGSYDIAWGVAIALGVIATLLNLPIKDQPVATPWSTAKA